MMLGYLWSLDCNISFSYIYLMDMVGFYVYMGIQYILLYFMFKVFLKEYILIMYKKILMF